MRRIMGRLEGAIISALEPIVRPRAQGRRESFARHILQTTTAHPVQTRPAQRFPVAAPVTHAQPAVLPKLAGRTEPLRCVYVSAEAASADRSHTRGRPQNLHFRQRLGRPQHQHLRFGL